MNIKLYIREGVLSEEEKKLLEALEDYDQNLFYDNYFNYDKKEAEKMLVEIKKELFELNDLKNMCYSNKEKRKRRIDILNSLIKKCGYKIDAMEYGSDEYQICMINFYNILIRVLKLIKNNQFQKYKSSTALYNDLEEKVNNIINYK